MAYLTDEQVEQIALAIYRELYPSVDSKQHKQQTLGDIEEWLSMGDLDPDDTVGELAQQFRECYEEE